MKNKNVIQKSKTRMSLKLLTLAALLCCATSSVWAQSAKTVHWVVVALDGSRALTVKNQTATIGANAVDAFPAKYKSPLLEDSDYSFFTTFAGAQTRDPEAQFSTVPSSLPTNDTIYVAYNFRKSYAESKGFKSTFGYNIKRVGANTGGDNAYLVQNDYINGNIDNDKNTAPQLDKDECTYFTGSTNGKNVRLIYQNENSLKEGRFIWRFYIDDPYQIRIQTMRDDGLHALYYGRYLTAKEKWSNGSGFRDSRVAEWSKIKSENRIWAYAIVPGNTDGSYKLLITDNMSHTPNSYGLDEQGHGYLNNARSGRLDNSTFDNHSGSNKVVNFSDITITPQSMTAFEYRIVTPLTQSAVASHVWIDTSAADASTQLAQTLVMPETLKRKYCTNYRFYSDKNFTNEITTYQGALDAGSAIIYVKYDIVGLPFIVSTNFQDAYWYRLKEDNSSTYIYSNNANSGKLAKGTDGTYTSGYFFAFMGDPYELRIINMLNGETRYLSLDYQTTETNHNNKQPEFNTNKVMGYWDIPTDENETGQFTLRLFGTKSGVSYYLTSNDSPLQTSSSKTVAKFEVALGKEFKYIFKILDRQRRIAMQYVTTMSMVTPLNYDRIPEAIRSEYISDETINFYSEATPRTTGTTISADGRQIYNEPANNKRITGAPVPLDINTEDEIPIYVTYTTNHLADKDLHLRGVRAFSMAVDGKYGYTDNSTTFLKSESDSPNNQNWWWHVIGNNDIPDPYAVQIQNIGASSNKYFSITTSPSVTQSMGASTSLSSFFVLMNSSQADDADKSITMGILPVGGQSVTYNSAYDPYLVPQDIKLVSRKKGITYYLIDRSGKLLLKSGPVSSDEPQIPDDIRSPFLNDNQYHYYDRRGHVTITDGTYTHDATELTSATDAVSDSVIVFYDACTSLSMYAGSQDNERNGVQMYLLKYDNGEYYNQENGADGFNDVATKAVYPYNNGELNLYVYGQEHFDKQMGQGASTRSRWGWFLQSANNDPYHVKIQSNQNQSTVNSIKCRSYLRSYMPSGYDHYVTGVITDNPRATATSESDWDTEKWGAAPTGFDYSGGSADNIPTEYMLLGSSADACKLVTTYIIDGTGTNATTYGAVETDYDVTNHYTVHSFEQYWKNNPTILNLVYEYNGATTDSEKSTIQTRLNASGLTNAEKLMLRNKGFHSYSAWANISSWSSTSSKTYQHTEHWFQSFEVGETFSFVPFSIDPALILLDQHGWEIMRRTLPKNADNAATVTAKEEAIKIYNSPMVKKYYWWTDGAKLPGYHKYLVETPFEKNGVSYTSATLDDVPYDASYADNTRVDLYVTYEVKEEYRSSYIGGADEGAASPSEFLIRQGANYAVADNSVDIITSTTLGTLLSAGNIAGITDAMKWWLKPNFNIDREMGYHYAGEAGSQDSALSPEETEADNYASRDADVTDLVNGRNGFDPYNLQIQNVEYGTYMTSSLSSTTVNTSGGFSGTYDGGNTLTLSDGSYIVNSPGHDQVPLNITNTVFMAVQDANGNMRLMPRFDHNNVLENFGRDSSDPAEAADNAMVAQADAQPANDQTHNQTTLLQIPKKFTYIVVDNQNREALRFESFDGETAPQMKPRFTSPFAKDFKFYSEATLEGSTYTINTTDTIASTGKLSDNAPVIYVRYGYDYKADNMAVLSGGHFKMKINDTDVRLDGSLIKSYSSDVPDEWKWFSSAKATINPDPYAMQIFNQDAYSTPISITVSATEYNRFIVLPFNDTSTEEYSLVTPTSGTFDYKFVDGNALATGATITQQSDYATATYTDLAPRAWKYMVEFAPYVPTSITYKIITNEGHVALTGSVATDDLDENYIAQLPAWMATPVMKSDAYRYYVDAESETVGGVEKITVDEYAETYSILNLEAGSVIYVRYDYNADTRQTVYTGRDGCNGPYILDLSGKQSYLLASYTRYYQDTNLTEDGNRTIAIIDNENNGMNITTPLSTRPLWLLQGNDPYEITIVNKHFDPTHKKIYANISFESVAPAASNDHYDKSLEQFREALKVYTDAEAAAAGYTKSTFMLLPCNFYQNNSGDNHEDSGFPSLAVTGYENLVVSRPNNSTDKMYIYQRTDGQKYRATYTEKVNNGRVPGHLRFEFVPMVEYHIITNEGYTALNAWSNYSRKNSNLTNGQRVITSDKTVGLPKFAQSPLLNEEDFRYFTTQPTWDDETSTLIEERTITVGDEVIVTNAIAAGTDFDDLLDMDTYTGGDIFVRYTYNRATSPLKIRTLDAYLDDDDSADDGLDLSGETLYNLANMFRGTNHGTGNTGGFLYATATNQFGFTFTLGVGTSSFKTLSAKNLLWRLEGNDPYAIRIYNSLKGNDVLLTIPTSGNAQWEAPETATNPYKTFMYMNAVANDEKNGQTDGYPYWHMLLATGSGNATQYIPKTGNGGASSGFNGTVSVTTFNSLLNDKLFLNSGNRGDYYITFFRANVARRYRFHAMNCATGSPEETWTATIEHDWLKPVVLEDAIARRYAWYETKSSTYSDDPSLSGEGITNTMVTSTGAYDTRENLGDVAQFYADEDMTKRIYYKDNTTTYYDYYPEIEEDYIYDIWFKYKPMTNAEIESNYPSDPFRFATASQVSADVATYAANKRLDSETIQTPWFFMVLDTDDNFSSTISGDTKTFTGNQYFLRREDTGTIGWMNNSFALHAFTEDNYNSYTPHRLAEWYRRGDNEAFREGRWLWAFIGDDPYNLNVLNMESAVGVTADAQGVYTLTAADNCYTTISSTTDEGTGKTVYPVTIPTEQPTPGENFTWGITNGYGTERTLRLQNSQITTTTEEGITTNNLLYWQMGTDGVEGDTYYSKDRTQSIQLIRYTPVQYEDINLVIKREEHVTDYNDWKEGKSLDEKRAKLQNYDSGISMLYFTAEERAYTAGDQIDMSSEDALPLNVRRAFCDYTLYSDDYDTQGGIYTVTSGPYPDTSVQATTTGSWVAGGASADDTYAPGAGTIIVDEDGRVVHPYYTIDANGYKRGAEGGAQSIYVKYKVTSDIFLKTAPTRAQVTEMAQNNDHVFFMDFPDTDTNGNDNTHHAFFDNEATFRIQTGDLEDKKDVNTGVWRTEKKTWNGSTFVDNYSDPYNSCQFRTDGDRMTSVPEDLKWYFVGDPYHVQVYNTAGAWNTTTQTDLNGTEWTPGTKGANLARINTIETNFQFVVDCVHMQVPDYTKIDNRPLLYPTDSLGNALDPIPNRNVGKPYFNDFYWEVVPATSTDPDRKSVV